MNNDFSITYSIKVFGQILIIIFSVIVCYWLLYNPYSLYFYRPELSEIPFKKREFYVTILTLTHLLILIGLNIFSIIRLLKRRQFVIITPLFCIITIYIHICLNNLYPNSKIEYTNDGFRYLEHRWTSGNKKTYKIFKSKEPFESYQNENEIVWQLESSK